VPRSLLTGLSLLAALLLGWSVCPSLALAQEAAPPIVEIAFAGNRTTLDSVMRRELLLHEGDPADPAKVERSRQAILDLGLFRKVEVTSEPLEAGVRLLFTVKEKWFLLAYPRLSANTDGENAVGAEVRWNNVMGRNHSLRALVSSWDQKEENRGRQLGYIVGYQMPYAFGTPYRLSFDASHSTTPSRVNGQPFDESMNTFQVLAGRKIGGGGAASQGWSAGSGVLWRSQDTTGDGAPEPYGDLYALVFELHRRDLHDEVFSVQGTRIDLRYIVGDQHVLSDYTLSGFTAGVLHAFPIGDTPHQTIELGANLGSSNGSRSPFPVYNLGGGQGLHGYPRNADQGDAYYLLSASYLRPIHWDWLRLALTVEAGNAADEFDHLGDTMHWSLGAGVRIRVPRLIDVDFEFGFAMPLSGGNPRGYGYRSI